MRYEDEMFIIDYNTCDEGYIDKMVSIVKERMPSVLNFFKLDYDGKIEIKLYDDLDKYKNNLENSFEENAKKTSETEEKEVLPREYCDWMIANTEDGKINMQSLDLVHTIDGFSNYTEQEFLFNVCHEFTHLCQDKIGSNSPGWFWEVIATTIGNPECQVETEDKFTLQDLEERFDEIDGYGAVYKIGKYLFDNYDSDFILSLALDNDKLYDVMPQVIETVNKVHSK